MPQIIKQNHFSPAGIEGRLASSAKLTEQSANWPKVTTTWAKALGLARFDDNGMNLKMKPDVKPFLRGFAQ